MLLPAKRIEVPKEVVRTVEVPKEVVRIVEVPKEVLRTVEVVRPDQGVVKELERVKQELDDRNIRVKVLMDFVQKLDAAPLLDSGKELTGIGAVRLVISIDKKIEDQVDRANIQTSTELKLRSLGITLEDNASDLLDIVVHGMWMDRDDKERVTFVYSCRSSVSEIVLRKKSGTGKETAFYNCFGDIWKHGTHGYAGAKVLRDAIKEAVVGEAEAFANAYLAANPKK
jgi:hypothetical protein